MLISFRLRQNENRLKKEPTTARSGLAEGYYIKAGGHRQIA